AIDQPGSATSAGLFSSTQAQADLLARRASASQFNDGFAQQLLRVLAATDSEFVISKEATPDLLFHRAQRLVLALARLSVAVNSEPPSTPKNPAFAKLFEDIRSRADFQPARFAEHLRNFRNAIDQAKH